MDIAYTGIPMLNSTQKRNTNAKQQHSITQILTVKILLYYKRFLLRFEPKFETHMKRPAMPAVAPNPDRMSAINSRRSLKVLASNGSSAAFFWLDILRADP